jgi:hypothetical protein
MLKFKLGTGIDEEFSDVDMSSLRPAREFARKYGCKALVYGPPGTGKTPILCNTSDKPVAVFHEAGTASLGDSNCPSWEAHDAARADEFYTWFTESNESRNFNTLITDSGSHLMKLYLDAEKGKGNKEGGDAHGKRVYGKAAERAGKWLEKIFNMPQKHVFVICKQEIVELGGIMTRRPSFDGNVLPRDIPHLYDCILHLDLQHVPGVTNPVTAFRCRNGFDVMARNRTMKLAEFEQPNAAALANKYMS